MGCANTRYLRKERESCAPVVLPMSGFSRMPSGSAWRAKRHSSVAKQQRTPFARSTTPSTSFPTHTPKDHHVLSSFPPGSDLCSLPQTSRPFPLWPPRSKARSARISGDYGRSDEQNSRDGQRGGCRKSGTLAKISALHEVGCMSLVRPEGHRFKEMNDPFAAA